jgi:ferredoxin
MSHNPQFHDKCIGCGRCASICPGLAITIVDRRYDPGGEFALVTVPWEMPAGILRPGMEVTTTGWEGERVGRGKVLAMKAARWQDRRHLAALEVPADSADMVAGILYRTPNRSSPRQPSAHAPGSTGEEDGIIICRCERVTRGEVAKKIREGCRDINALKAELRVGMGPCGGKTCMPLIMRLFRELGVGADEVTPHVERPFTQEVAMRSFLGEVRD